MRREESKRTRFETKVRQQPHRFSPRLGETKSRSRVEVVGTATPKGGRRERESATAKPRRGLREPRRAMREAIERATRAKERTRDAPVYKLDVRKRIGGGFDCDLKGGEDGEGPGSALTVVALDCLNRVSAFRGGRWKEDREKTNRKAVHPPRKRGLPPSPSPPGPPVKFPSPRTPSPCSLPRPTASERQHRTAQS
jgi:hypothetical protein